MPPLEGFEVDELDRATDEEDVLIRQQHAVGFVHARTRARTREIRMWWNARTMSRSLTSMTSFSSN